VLEIRFAKASDVALILHFTTNSPPTGVSLTPSLPLRPTCFAMDSERDDLRQWMEQSVRSLFRKSETAAGDRQQRGRTRPSRMAREGTPAQEHVSDRKLAATIGAVLRTTYRMFRGKVSNDSGYSH
jgi:hypothetical protein